MFNVKIVGAGQLGSRHLQALKGVHQPLNIQVIDPSDASLQVARERYDAVPGGEQHTIAFGPAFASSGVTDVAIVATNADVRRQALTDLLDAGPVKFLIAEKLLFNEKSDYAAFEKRLSQTNTLTWVNCPMRLMPIYESIQQHLAGSPLFYRVTGSQFGLVTNAIHYIDHVAHLAGCDEYTLDTSGLEGPPIASKRRGFVELNGTLVARFGDGSRCDVTCYPAGSSPVVVEIFDEKNRYIVRESEGKLWHASEGSGWQWHEAEAPIPFQSQITTGVVTALLEAGTCGLTPYASSARIHQQLLEPLQDHLRAHLPVEVAYQFT